MADMNVTYSEMTGAAARLRQGQQEMETKLAELGSLIDGLVTSGFQTGHASGAYQDTFHQFQTGTKQAIDALDGLASYLEQAAQAIENTDTQLASSIHTS